MSLAYLQKNSMGKKPYTYSTSTSNDVSSIFRFQRTNRRNIRSDGKKTDRLSFGMTMVKCDTIANKLDSIRILFRELCSYVAYNRH